MKFRITSYITIISLFVISSKFANGQTVFATETFGSGSARGTLANGFVGDMGTWTVNSTGTNGPSANNWFMSGEECGNAAGACGSVCSNSDNSLHISAIGGLCGTPDCGAAYDESSGLNETNLRAESPIINCTAKGNIFLNFNYIAAQGDDGFTIEYTPDGVTWTTISTPAASLCCACDDAFLCAFLFMCCGGPSGPCTGLEQGEWTPFTIALPASADNNPTVQIAFNWNNDGNGIGTDPSVAIDDLTISHDVILPVVLSSFTGESIESINELSWTTESELNSDYFEIEHSVNGKFYQTIGRIKGQGNSAVSSNYSYNHQTGSQNNYYRLKQVDMDGNYKYSENILLKNDLSGIILYIEADRIKITGLENHSGTISIFDLYGRMVINQQPYHKDINEITISTTNLIKGIYIVNVEGSNGKKIFRFII